MKILIKNKKNKNNLNFFKTIFLRHKTNSYFTINKIGPQLLMKLLFKPQLLINQSLCFCGCEKKQTQTQTQTHKQAHVSNNFYSCLDVENIVLRNGYGVDAMPPSPIVPDYY